MEIIYSSKKTSGSSSRNIFKFIEKFSEIFLNAKHLTLYTTEGKLMLSACIISTYFSQQEDCYIIQLAMIGKAGLPVCLKISIEKIQLQNIPENFILPKTVDFELTD